MRSVFANGFPKTGNHGLVKACELLGVPASVNYKSFAEGMPPGTTHHIHIKRDPRNVVISMLRFNGQPVTPGTFLARFRRFQDDSIVEEMAQFEPWLADAHTLTVAWEDLIASDATMRQIAAYVDVPYIEGAWERLPGRTYTWNDKHSDFRDIWTRQVASAWRDEGGDNLLRVWGYEPWKS
jgi:hypothetical protein